MKISGSAHVLSFIFYMYIVLISIKFTFASMAKAVLIYEIQEIF